MLSDFFRINLPYGLVGNKEGYWMVFNRESKPIGFNIQSEINFSTENETTPAMFSFYPLLSDSLILELIDYDESSVKRDNLGNIKKFWLYNDQTNPMNQREKENEYWKTYWNRLESLAKLSAFG